MRMASGLSEALVEKAALAWLEALGWETREGVDLAPDTLPAERTSFGDAVLEQQLRDALARLNPTVPAEALDDAARKLVRLEGSTLEARNRAFHRLLVDGVEVEYRTPEGSIRGDTVRVVDFDTAKNNDWLAVNQFTVVENKRTRRLDVVLFLNGLPIGILELKNAAAEQASIWSAWSQLQTYKAELETLFAYNELLMISDGTEARVGTLTAGKEWFKPWRTISGEDLAPKSVPEMQVAIEGMLDHGRLLDLLRSFIAFEDRGGEKLVKKMAGYHQFHAVRAAVGETLRAAELEDVIVEPEGHYESGRQPGGDVGDRRVGVVWHTQGSGKSLTMAFYAGRIVLEPAMRNPTLVVLTDRNDLDDQLFGTFAQCSDLLRQSPKQAQSREDLRKLLEVESGGVVFTTVHKFFPGQKGERYPMLSDRRNIVVIADEAHRSQYDFIDGFAAHMRDALPNASFIGFTGTPIEKQDANTRAVFGEYISVYDIQRAVQDGATVPIYYESRLAKLRLEHGVEVDEEFDELTEGEELEGREKLKTKWAALEALVGESGRLELVARDLVEHYEKRCEVLEGKAMVVCMSRRICVELYEKIVAIRPEWHDADDAKGAIKVVMTGSASDGPEWQQHIRTKARRKALGDRFRDPEDPLRIVLVRDMWLTGFDAPVMHTMYVDKPMRGHGLMQAIARVNRVFKDKPGGLVVDYIGLASDLKRALQTYTESGGQGSTALDKEEAVALLLEKHDVCCGILDGFDRSAWSSALASERLAVLPAAQEFVLAQKDGKQRWLDAVNALSKAFALAVPHPDAQAIREDVELFQAIRASLLKKSPEDPRRGDDLDHAIRQIVDKAIAPDGVLDIFEAAGLDKPEISILSDEFLREVQGMQHRNLAVELLQKLLQGELAKRRQKNVVQSRTFSEMLQQSLLRYQNRAIEAAQVIEELIALAKEMRKAQERGEDLGLSEDELAFYDALESNDSAVQVLGDETLRDIARELVDKVRASVTIGWTVRENVRARLRVMVKRILRKWGYPPDLQERATALVLEQAEVLSEGWVG